MSAARIRIRIAAATAGIALLAAACGSSQAKGTTSPPTTGAGGTQASTAAMVVVKTASVAKAGTVLVDSSGRTLYTFTLDKPGHIACNGSCLTTWPPLLVPAGKTVSSMAGLGTEKRANGDIQVTYHGSPLYTFSGDTAPGQDNGASIPDWKSAVATSGATTGTTATPTTAASGGGYGY